MKRLFMGSFALLFFSASMLIFQMSCRKEAQANPTSGVGKIAYLIISDTSQEIWIANLDGTAQTRIFSSTSSVQISTNAGVDISADGTKVVFASTDSQGNSNAVYSINIDGTNLTQVTQTNDDQHWIYGVSAN